MDNPEKLATYSTQDEEKQNKNTTQYVLDTTTKLDKKLSCFSTQIWRLN
jgi:hypothetical protein